jgi:hypothetical protein
MPNTAQFCATICKLQKAGKTFGFDFKRGKISQGEGFRTVLNLMKVNYPTDTTSDIETPDKLQTLEWVGLLTGVIDQVDDQTRVKFDNEMKIVADSLSKFV